MRIDGLHDIAQFRNLILVASTEQDVLVIFRISALALPMGDTPSGLFHDRLFHLFILRDDQKRYIDVLIVETIGNRIENCHKDDRIQSRLQIKKKEAEGKQDRIDIDRQLSCLEIRMLLDQAYAGDIDAAAAAAAEQPSPTEQTESTSELPEVVTISDSPEDTRPSEEPERTEPAATSTVDKETRAQDPAPNAPSSEQPVSDKRSKAKALGCDVECSHCHKGVHESSRSSESLSNTELSPDITSWPFRRLK